MNRVLLPVAVAMLLVGALVAAFSHHPWTPRPDVVQPIPFSHRVHAGVHQIPCQYCHAYARRSQMAGVPPVQRCLGCHMKVGGEQPVLTLATQPWIEMGPLPGGIAWQRVYTLPDFVRFAHRPHVLAGIHCQECHGPVETMDRVVPVHTINMGFCLACHTERGASRDCVTCHY
ncbi:MAG TPA: cytochrome c3 family protein [bacterium]